MPIERQPRPRRRAQGLIVDPTTTLDLTGIDPLLDLGPHGQALWDTWAANPPFWWSEEDLPAAAVLAAATDTAVDVLAGGERAAGKAAIVKEWRMLADQLGLTPTSRGRMKLTEAQSVVAAQRAEATGADTDQRAEAIPVDDLLDGDD